MKNTKENTINWDTLYGASKIALKKFKRIMKCFSSCIKKYGVEGTVIIVELSKGTRLVLYHHDGPSEFTHPYHIENSGRMYTFKALTHELILRGELIN